VRPGFAAALLLPDSAAALTVRAHRPRSPSALTVWQVHVRLDPSFADADATLEASQVASRSEAALTIAVAGGGGESVTVSITREVEDCTVFDASFSVDGAWTLIFELLRFGPLI
jgi:hypothetical protein